MAFFSSPSLPKLPFPGEPWGSLELAGLLWTELPHELGARQCMGEMLGSPGPGLFPGENRGRGPQAMPQLGGEGDPQLWASFCPSGLLLGRGKRETKCGDGGGRVSEATDFVCATRMGIAALCAPRPAAAWGPSCSEQGGVWEGAEGRNGGAEEMGAALGLSVGIGEPEMAALPGSEQLL